VVIRGLEGNNVDDSLSAGFSLSVSASDKSTYRLLFILLTLFAMTVAGIWFIYVKIGNASSGSGAMNFLDIRLVKGLFLWKYIQPAFQVPLSILLFILIILTLTDIQDAGRNVSAILIWTIWWAGIIFTFVLVGRLGCFMCPVGAFAEWTARIFKPHRLFPLKLRNVWLANGMFIMLTWFDIQLGVVRHPVVTGSLLLGIIVIALVVSMLYARRSFCRYLCPIGGIIGIYSMFSAVELRSKDPEVCRGHKRKDCYLGNEMGYGCPMFEMIPTMDSNNACTFCGECIKSCPKNNIVLRVRPFFKDVWTTKKRTLDEAALAVVLVGISIFVTGDMLEPWAGWIEAAMTWVPAQQLGIQYEFTVEIIAKSVLYFSISLLLIPGFMLFTAAISNRMVGSENHNGLKQTFITFGYMFIPIGLSMHLAHNTGHLLNESGKIVPALKRAINTYTPFYLGEPDWRVGTEPLLEPALLYWIQMGIFLIFFGFSLYAGYRIAMMSYRDSQTAFHALIPMIVFSFILMVVNVYLLNLPMAPRHIH
jgi:polyferredoxin